ncbi:AAA family ATPase [Mycolicibacterium sp. 141076]|nr:AAA family ATPase [Mycolicibacterium sp. 141076]MDX1880091.1 AAA family ATPase [Mycolicibacterium sp. 141076]
MTTTEPDTTDSLLAGIVTAAELSHEHFPDLTEFVPGIIFEGFGIVAGPPKLGKSWLTLGIALAVAGGGRALGQIECAQRPVLLLALEDSQRRLQSRITTLWGTEIPPYKLHLLTQVGPNLLVPTISAWLQQYPNGLVVLDTLGRARRQRRNGEDPYLADYAAGVELKQCVDAFPGSALLGVHHTRKAHSDDFIDALSGTQGLAGSADYVLVLKRPRNSTEATLQLTGRDAPEGEYALTVQAGAWLLNGRDLNAASDAAQTLRERGNLGDRSADILNVVNARTREGLITTAADISAKIGITQNDAGTYLRRLADAERIAKVSRGTYMGVSETS